MIESISAKEFIRILKSDMNIPDSKFAFFLGSGCSISSGIPAAGECVKRWIPRLKKQKDEDYNKWAKREIDEYDEKNASKFYKKVMEALFNTPVKRQKEIEKITDGKDPGFGYAVMAQLISSKKYGHHFNTILTTNFDDLVADALYLYSQKKPLVITHESLIHFFNIVRERPSIIKLHGDARIYPKNTDTETNKLEKRVQEVLEDVLCKVGLIFLGYGGNDKSITKTLQKIPKKTPLTFPYGIYWIGNSIPDNPLGEWLKEMKAIHVKHRDFDELMLLLLTEFELNHPSEERFKELMNSYFIKFKDLGGKIEKAPTSEEKRSLEDAFQIATGKIKSWRQVYFEAEKFARTEPDKADRIYRNGLINFPNSIQLIEYYAIFLTDILKDYAQAEKYFQKALSIDPSNFFLLGNYAKFLTDNLKDHARAEEYYQKALAIDPSNPIILGKYANFFNNILKDHVQAEEYYQKALAIDPSNVSILGNFANFLTDILKDQARAEEYYQKVLAIDPSNVSNLGNFANFLTDILKDHARAEEYYQKALAIDPSDVNILGNFAYFLTDILKDHARAEEYYQKALAIDPSKPHILGNFAGFLLSRDEYERGMEMLDKASKGIVDPPALLPEILFYYYAHSQDVDEQQKNLVKLKKVLLSGIRSPGWNLTENVNQAIKDGHPHPEFLKCLAKVVSEDASIEELDQFDIWTSIRKEED